MIDAQVCYWLGLVRSDIAGKAIDQPLWDKASLSNMG
jgi:hypothetical protein